MLLTSNLADQNTQKYREVKNISDKFERIRAERSGNYVVVFSRQALCKDKILIGILIAHCFDYNYSATTGFFLPKSLMVQMKFNMK